MPRSRPHIASQRPPDRRQEERRAAVRAADRAADGDPRHHGGEHRAAEPRERPELSGSSISWTITSYSLIFGSLLLFGGRAADLLGRRRMFVTGLGVFTTASFASAMAGTAGALFAARAGQGLGAAMLSPAALAIIMTAFQGHQRAKALAAWGAVGGAGAAIGVLVGGVLTEFTDWRMIFYVNLPVAAALAVAALKVVPADTRKPRWRGSTCAEPCSRQRASPPSSSRSPRPKASAGLAPDASGRPRRPRRARGLRRARAPHRCTAPARSSGWRIAPSAAASSSCSPRPARSSASSCSARSTSRTSSTWGRSRPASPSSPSR